jgi:glyoxylase-like metal-dependent hydrolase (beta-lactamase superfamily II)
MDVTPVGTRGRIISFPELGTTNLFLILGPKTTYLCDTFLGPEPMKKVRTMLEAEGRSQPIALFNSHKDWDHVWGNCAFPDSTIIATEACVANMRESFAAELAEYGEMAQGQVLPAYPNLAFTGRLVYPDDDVLFLSTPGHTDGSGSCFDRVDGTLFVGDNVEFPIPYLFSTDLTSYADTLRSYLDMNPTTLITGHGQRETMTLDLVRVNLAYVMAMAAGEQPDETRWDERAHSVHRQNVRWLADHS